MSSPDWSERVKDPAWRQLMQAARGIPLSIFLGRKISTVHEYDTAGRLVRSTQDAAWLEDDRLAVLALADFEAGLCGGCGQPLSETTDPANEDTYKAGLAIRCHRCTASIRGAERYQESSQASALMIPILRA